MNGPAPQRGGLKFQYKTTMNTSNDNQNPQWVSQSGFVALTFIALKLHQSITPFCLGLTTSIACTFAILKYLTIISWTWWWVFSPVIIAVMLVIILGVLLRLCLYLAK